MFALGLLSAKAHMGMAAGLVTAADITADGAGRCSSQAARQCTLLDTDPSTTTSFQVLKLSPYRLHSMHSLAAALQHTGL